jgi:hypothetical protein
VGIDVFIMNESKWEKLLDEYRSIELRVGKLMTQICAPYCRVCPTPCCRLDICKEAVESPFLLAVHGAGISFDAKNGYLGCSGCRLKVGRPPICHAFVCDRIMNDQKEDLHRYAIDCVGELMTYIGKRSWRGRQLVEAMTTSDLTQVDTVSLSDRLQDAFAALAILEPYFAESKAWEEHQWRTLLNVRKRH